MAKHENLKALFTAIATSIRNKTGGTDAIIADDFPEAIDGIQTGGGVDKIQQLVDAKGVEMRYLFADMTLENADELIAGIDTSKVTGMSYLFSNCKNLKTVPLFDTSKVIYMSYMFDGCVNLTTVPLFDTRNVTGMYCMFSGCVNLKTVPQLDIRKVGTISSMFSNCKALTEIWVRNIKAPLQVGYGTTYGHLLTLESLLHLCKECRKTTSSLTLTVGTANLEKLANVYVKLIDVTDDMRVEDDLIDEKYPFVQCQSTDADAMTIQDYMATKMWSLA